MNYLLEGENFEGLDSFFPLGLFVSILISVNEKLLIFRKIKGLNSGYFYKALVFILSFLGRL